MGNDHLVDSGRQKKTLHVLRQAEHGGLAVRTGVTADALEHAHAVVQGVGEHMHLGFVPGHEFTVEPDFFRLLHGILQKIGRDT